MNLTGSQLWQTIRKDSMEIGMSEFHFSWWKQESRKINVSVSPHTVASPPCSIHLGKKFLIPNHSKVKSSQSEVQIGVSIL